MKFKLKGGSHTENGVTYSKGDVITTDIDLAAKFSKNRFERQGRVVDEDVEQPVIESVRTKGKKKPKRKESKEEKDVRGLDVTEDFAVAKEAGFTVFEKERWFTVFDENSILLNDKKLRKKDVPFFLEEYLADDEVEEIEEDDEGESIQFVKGNRVIVDIDGEEFAGKIIKITKDNKATVKFDDGDTDTYPLDELMFESEVDGD